MTVLAWVVIAVGVFLAFEIGTATSAVCRQIALLTDAIRGVGPDGSYARTVAQEVAALRETLRPIHSADWRIDREERALDGDPLAKLFAMANVQEKPEDDTA